MNKIVQGLHIDSAKELKELKELSERINEPK